MNDNATTTHPPDLTGTWTGIKQGRPATLKDLQLYRSKVDGELRVSYIFRLGGRQTGRDGGAGTAPLSAFVGPTAIYHRSR